MPGQRGTLALAVVLALATAAEPAAPGEREKATDAGAAQASSAATGSAQREPQLTLQERVTVTGTPETLSEIPGAAQALSGQELERRKQGFDDVHRLLRGIPGLNLQEEEGFGHKPNIGMRGSGTDRSSKISLMEDGVPIAPAPYSAPAAYYFPVAGRMEGIEVRKGSSQIKYGPNTVGGALNLVSTSIPSEFRLRARAGGGQHGSGNLHAFAGDSHRRLDWLLETYQGGSRGFKRLEGGGDTGFRLQDYLGKLRLHSSRGARVYQQLELKLGATEQDSDETYLGLADADFRRDPLRRYAASQLDRFEASHRQYQLRHFVAFSSRADLTTTVWRNDFQRRWYKLESVRGRGLAGVLEDPAAFPAEFAALRGGDADPDALVVRNNDREYFSHGFQTSAGLEAGWGATRHLIEAGVRYTEDQEDRFQQDDGYRMLDSRMLLTRAGAPGSQSNQVASAGAWAFFLQDRIQWGRFSLVPGLRFEAIELVRTDYSRGDPARTAPTAVRGDRVNVFVPGLGASLRVADELHVIAGVHKGFAPPGPGADTATLAEESLNYELGLRASARGLSAELTAFYNDFDNMLGRDSLASGGSGSGDLFNGGEVRVLGLEAGVSLDLRHALGLGFSLPLRASYTLTDSEFRNGFESTYGPWGAVQAGDALPYAPAQQLFSSLGAAHDAWLLELSASYVSRMRTRAGQGPMVDSRSTDAAVVLDLAAEYAVRPRLRLFGSVQNLTDRRSAVARHPAGVRPGLPRTFMAGVKLQLGS